MNYRTPGKGHPVEAFTCLSELLIPSNPSRPGLALHWLLAFPPDRGDAENGARPPSPPAQLPPPPPPPAAVALCPSEALGPSIARTGHSTILGSAEISSF
uniref:Uncharacterized protein n=1 Tax=Steinernema glaseri TaxID=37863 RepID=A0A1I7Z4K8_9BILA